MNRGPLNSTSGNPERLLSKHELKREGEEAGQLDLSGGWWGEEERMFQAERPVCASAHG